MSNIIPKVMRYKRAFQWLLAFVCFSYVVLFFWKNRESLKDVLSFNFISIIYLVLFYIIAFILQCYRYRVVIHKCSGAKVPFVGWFKIFMVGMLLSRIVPQAGNIYRSIHLRKDFQVSYTRYISSYASFVWFDTVLNLIIALVVVLILKPDLYIGNLKAYYVIFFLVVVVMVIPPVLNILCASWQSRAKYFRWLHSKISEVFRVSVSNISDVIYISKITLTGILSFFNTMMVFYVCFGSIGVQVELSILTLFCVILKLSNLVILTPGNLGVREVAYGILGKLANIGVAEALLVSVITRVVGTLLIFTLGTVFGGFGLLRRRDDYTCDEG